MVKLMTVQAPQAAICFRCSTATAIISTFDLHFQLVVARVDFFLKLQWVKLCQPTFEQSLK